MKKKILMQLTAAALTAGMCISVAGAAFNDVPANAWYSKAVTTCEEANLMKGYTDGNFRPSANVTRAECAQILARFNSGASMTIPYADVQEGKWYYDVVRNFGSYLGGSDMDKKNYTDLAASQYFYPEKPCNREDFAMGLYHALGYDQGSVTEHQFKDMNAVSNSTDAYYNYKQAVSAVANNGLMVGDTNGNFNPQKEITRAEVAQVLSNYLAKNK